MTDSTMGIKLICLITRPDGQDRAAFLDWWLGHHARVAARLPGLKRYTINVVDRTDDNGDAPFDGVAELWFTDAGAMAAAFASPQGRLCADEDRHLLGGRIALVTREHPIV